MTVPGAPGALARLRRLLEHERLPLVAALFAVVLALPALASGRVVDDHVQARIFAEGVGIMGTPTRPLDMFSFFPDDAAGRAELLRYGMWPWWASEDLHLEFWRPLTALTHWADHALYPEAVALHHLHSILWYALVAWLAARRLRRLLEPRWVAGLAALWYAAADVHALPAGWLANRSALCATAAGLCALWAHDRWRREGWRPGGALGPLAFAAALGAGEYGLGIAGYLLAHALWLDPAPRRRSLLALAPYALVALGWALLDRALGYGATGSGLYLDPAHDPLAFASAVLTRAPVLVASQLFVPLADLFPFLPRDRTWVLTVGGALGVGLCLAVLRPAEASPTRRLLAAGALLSLVPVCATFPNDRLSFFSSLGVTALVADLAARAAALPRARRALAWLLVLRQA
ncbi:MAG: hypothetical protein IT373_24420, partial [Polyangiaceae bacterium]|nr:hypothetical protein [Polyangiaceae bacterium]